MFCIDLFSDEIAKTLVIISGVILGAIDGGLDSTNTGWGLVGDILIGGVKGGLIAAAWALSFAGGTMVGAGLGSVGGAFALAGGGIMSGGAVAGVATAIAGVGVIVVGGTIAQQLHILLSKWEPGSFPGLVTIRRFLRAMISIGMGKILLVEIKGLG